MAHDNSDSYLASPNTEEGRKRREERKKRREEDRKRREEDRKRRERESDHNSDERSPKRAKTESGYRTPQSVVTTNGKGGGGGPSTDQSKTNSRLPHLKKGSSLPVMRSLITELDGVVHPKSKMVEGVKELIKMDLNMEEDIGMAIEMLDNSLKCCCDLQDLGEMVIHAVSQAQRAQLAMKRAKEEQNKLRSALYDLLPSVPLASSDTYGQG